MHISLQGLAGNIPNKSLQCSYYSVPNEKGNSLLIKRKAAYPAVTREKLYKCTALETNLAHKDVQILCVVPDGTFQVAFKYAVHMSVLVVGIWKLGKKFSKASKLPG